MTQPCRPPRLNPLRIGGILLPCGRLRHELRLLLASARDSRAFDPTLPDVTSWLVTRGASRVVAAPAPVDDPPAPR